MKFFKHDKAPLISDENFELPEESIQNNTKDNETQLKTETAIVMRKIDYIRSRKKRYAKRGFLFLVLQILFFVGMEFLEKLVPSLVISNIGVFLLIGVFMNCLVYIDLTIFEIPFSSRTRGFSQMKNELEEELTAEAKQEIDGFGYMTAFYLLIDRMG